MQGIYFQRLSIKLTNESVFFINYGLIKQIHGFSMGGSKSVVFWNMLMCNVIEKWFEAYFLQTVCRRDIC